MGVWATIDLVQAIYVSTEQKEHFLVQVTEALLDAYVCYSCQLLTASASIRTLDDSQPAYALVEDIKEQYLLVFESFTPHPSRINTLGTNMFVVGTFILDKLLKALKEPGNIKFT